MDEKITKSNSEEKLLKFDENRAGLWIPRRRATIEIEVKTETGDLTVSEIDSVYDKSESQIKFELNRGESSSPVALTPKKISLCIVPNNILGTLSAEFTNIEKFVKDPLLKGIRLKCSIRRENKGFSRFYPKYFFHITEGWKFLLASKKRGGNKSSNYCITTDPNDFSIKSKSYIGKVRSNFTGSEFTIFDSGLNPKKKNIDISEVRQELGAVLYVHSM